MLIIIPLGGTGERFKRNGYKEPKALIKVFGKPILYYLLDNLSLTDDHCVYIPYNKEYKSYRLEDVLRKDYPQVRFHFFCLEQNTCGAAETLSLALVHAVQYLSIPDTTPFISLDGDNFYTTDVVEKWSGKNSIFVVDDTESTPIYSYIKMTGEGRVTQIAEKDKISDLACTGAYGFISIRSFLNHCSTVFVNHQTSKGEYYISSVIAEMIHQGVEFSGILINKQSWTCLGSPMQVRIFCNNYPLVSCTSNEAQIKRQRYCFDLDNTLVTTPIVAKDYTTVRPIQKNIDFLKYLRKFGHTIIIYTARRMKTYGGNTGAVVANIGKITLETLEQFDIPYDEIYFGKPFADVYIDDAALNAYDNLEKGTGYYMDTIDPREFNSIKQSTLETIKKESEDLSGEIYYYTHIPPAIKDMFPCLIDYDAEGNTWYSMEKINGLSLTTLYLAELMTEIQLRNVMNSIQRIHNTPCDEQGNIYANYSSKLEKRFANYDYSQFKGSASKYFDLFTDLRNYEEKQMGKRCVIHGDTVMTNIMINQYDKIKFIDMRGKMGDDLTICGDYLYDWAKLYQSLIGYDEILQGKTVSDSYKKQMSLFFETYFIEMFSEEELKWVKVITRSLFFSLIPLHDNNKCEEYFKLA